MDNLNDVIASLSSEDIEMLKGVASSLLGGEAQGGTPALAEKNSGNALTGLGLNQDDFQMMMKAKTIFDKMNSASSKNTDLINALKPHLSEQSRQKADQAIRIMKLFEVLPYLKDLF